MRAIDRKPILPAKLLKREVDKGAKKRDGGKMRPEDNLWTPVSSIPETQT